MEKFWYQLLLFKKKKQLGEQRENVQDRPVAIQKTIHFLIMEKFFSAFSSFFPSSLTQHYALRSISIWTLPPVDNQREISSKISDLISLTQVSKSPYLEADHCHLDHRNKVEVVVVSLKPLPPQEEEVEVVKQQQQQEQEQKGMDRMVKQSLKKKKQQCTTVTPYKQQLIFYFCVPNMVKQF